jgi:opine dehydrogenase
MSRTASCITNTKETIMPVREVAVLGGGNGALTTAGDMALAGFNVRLWTAFPGELGKIYETKTIKVAGPGRRGHARLALVTKDIREAVKGAEVIVSPSPAFAQPDIAGVLATHIEDRQTIFLSPGSMGSYLFARAFRETGRLRDIAIAEPGTLPYLTRKVAPDEVLVSGRAVRLPVGVFPAKKTDYAVGLLKELYPSIHPVENALSVALLNVGPVIHPVLVLLNTGPVESLEAWDIHNEGTTPSVKKLILAHDQERIALRKALGFTSHHYPFSDHYDQTGKDEWMYGRGAHSELVKSKSWREKLDFSHRYIQEDVKCNLALHCSIADFCAVETPISHSLLTLIGAVAGEDFTKTGRTLASLGLSECSKDELMNLLAEGL